MNLRFLEELVTDHCCAKVELWEHLKDRLRVAMEAGRLRRNAVKTPEDLASYTITLRERLLESLGGLPSAPSGPPPATITGEQVCRSYTIQKLLLEPRPGVLASANLYLPEKRAPRNPAILFLCGHGAPAKQAYYKVCQVLVQLGFIVLVLDPVGQGERMSYLRPGSTEPSLKSSLEHEYVGLQCTLQGHNLSRYMVHDAIRAVDYLSAHPEVDPSRIGVTGSSGGGLQTTLMMALEPRVAAAAPGTFLSSFRSIFDTGFRQDAEQNWRGFAGMGYDHVDLLAAFAPKPLCVLAVTYDFFPIEGTRETVSEALRFWEMFHCPERLVMVEEARTHAYSRYLANRAGEFFARHLSHTPPIAPEDAVVENFNERDLWCTPHGQVLFDYPQAKTVFQENLETFEASRAVSGLQVEKAREFLRNAVFHARQPVAPNLRVIEEKWQGNLRYRIGYWYSQKGLHNSAILLLPAEGEGPLPLTLAVWEDGTRQIGRHDRWIRQTLAQRRAVLVLNLSGMGPLEPFAFRENADPKSARGSFFRICDNFLSLGDSFAALRTYDVIRALDTLPEWGGLKTDDLALYGEGNYGIYAALAAAIEPRLARFRWDNPMPPYEELLRSRYYDDYDIKSLILPGLLPLADWSDLVP